MKITGKLHVVFFFSISTETDTSQALFRNPQEKKKCEDGQKTTGEGQPNTEMRQAGVKWNELELRAQDSNDGRNIVDALCYTVERRI